MNELNTLTDAVTCLKNITSLTEEHRSKSTEIFEKLTPFFDKEPLLEIYTDTIFNDIEDIAKIMLKLLDDQNNLVKSYPVCAEALMDFFCDSIEYRVKAIREAFNLKYRSLI